MVFKKLNGLVVPGTIVFDEYFNYPGWKNHEFNAFQEYVQQNGVSYSYDSFVSSYQQVCIVIDKCNGWMVTGQEPQISSRETSGSIGWILR